MGYRQLEHKPKHKHRDFHDTSSNNKIFIQNGVTGYFAIPCWYNEMRRPIHTKIHDIDKHDHLGWPDPKHPDHSCQSADRHHLSLPYDHCRHGWHVPSRLIDMSKVFPIHLSKEGYESISIAFDNPPEGLEASGEIDHKDDWVIRLSISPKCEKIVNEDVDVPYTVFANGYFDDRKVTHMVTKGIIHIIAGPIP